MYPPWNFFKYDSTNFFWRSLPPRTPGFSTRVLQMFFEKPPISGIPPVSIYRSRFLDDLFGWKPLDNNWWGKIICLDCFKVFVIWIFLRFVFSNSDMKAPLLCFVPFFFEKFFKRIKLEVLLYTFPPFLTLCPSVKIFGLNKLFSRHACFFQKIIIFLVFTCFLKSNYIK